MEKNEGITLILADRTPFEEDVSGQILKYRLDTLSKGAIHKAIKSFNKKEESLWKDVKTKTITIEKESYSSDQAANTFANVEHAIRNSRCIIICTSRDEPCSYFWLGFAHGLEKDVIPVSTIHENEKNYVDALPFDVRALWHIYFQKEKPIALEQQITTILV